MFSFFILNLKGIKMLILCIFNHFYIKASPFQKWTFLKMSNSKKIAKLFFAFFFMFLNKYIFIM